jgi:hypothetical protein
VGEGASTVYYNPSTAVLVLRAAGFEDDASKTEESLTKRHKLYSLLIKRKVGNQGWNIMDKSYACNYLSFFYNHHLLPKNKISIVFTLEILFFFDVLGNVKSYQYLAELKYMEVFPAFTFIHIEIVPLSYFRHVTQFFFTIRRRH